MKKRFYDLNTYFRNRYGERVHKISIDAGLTCPNRDGTIDRAGCIFCNAKGSGTGNFTRGYTITEQLENSKGPVIKRFKAKKFIAYFQSFTNTYAPFDTLKKIYDEALAVPDVVGLAIGTRPDCISGEILDLLQAYAEKYLIWIEYGLQSSHDPTLKRINRGHDVQAFEDAVLATAGRGIKISAHIILGLPGETRREMLATADYIAALPIDGIKLHLLYVIKGTALERLYKSGQYRCLERSAYIDLVCDVMERIPGHMVIQRLTGDPHKHELSAPLWALEKNENVALIRQRLEKRDTWQGRLFESNHCDPAERASD
jgi:radical SAM protein (TIGR01212 family)